MTCILVVVAGTLAVVLAYLAIILAVRVRNSVLRLVLCSALLPALVYLGYVVAAASLSR